MFIFLAEVTLSSSSLTKAITLLCSTASVMLSVSGCSSSSAGAVSNQPAEGSASGVISRNFDIGTAARLGSDSASTASTTPNSTVTPAVVTTTATVVPVNTTTGSGAPSANSASTVKKSIKNWASCNGTTDDNDALARAISAAKNDAFTLVIDCPLLIKIGQDIAKPIFIDSGTTIEFTGAGKITVDNVFIPAFVLANSRNVSIKDANIEYDASLPVNVQVGGYENKGQFYAGPNPGGAFNDMRLTPWLAANRAVSFDRSKGASNALWNGWTNICGIFYMSGQTQDITFNGMKVYAPANANADHFIPVVFTTNADWKSRQTVSSSTPQDARYLSIPSDLTFSNITLDGTYFGWVGIAKNVTVENINSNRYGDVQDANGNNVGGVGKWFAPPHLFYWSMSHLTDQALWNRNIQIKNVVDSGTRLGKARDKGGSDSVSGYAPSLKIACIDCVVDTYKSTRPDGFVDVLTSSGLTVSNVTASYDSSFTNNLYPGFRWPATNYKSVTFENIQIKDVATATYTQPISSTTTAGNDGIVLTNVQVSMNKWAGSGSVYPSILGNDVDVAIDYSMSADATRAELLQKSPESVQLKAAPATIRAGQTTTLAWTGRNITSCTASGAWSGALGTDSSKSMKLSAPGNYDYTITCQDSDETVMANVRVVVQ